MQFGERMRAKRKALGLTLAELGEKVGYSHVALSALETGRSNGRRGSAKAVKAFLALRGGPTMAKTKKPAKAPRKPKAATSVMDTLAGLISALEALRAAVEANTAAMAPKPPAVDPLLVPSVAEQRARTEAMTAGIAQNGLRKPKLPPELGARLATNSLDPVPGASLLPVTRAVGAHA